MAREYSRLSWNARGKTTQNYWKLLINKKYFKSLAPENSLGSIEWEIICPVCCGQFHSRDKMKGVVTYLGQYVDFKYANNVDVVALPDKTAIVVCSTKCRQMFELSPMIYERNYL